MRPLNYAILKYLTTAPHASAEDIVRGLDGEYHDFKMLNQPAVLEALMTAEQNGLLEKVSYELDDQQNVRIYFKTTEYGEKMIRRYIK